MVNVLIVSGGSFQGSTLIKGLVQSSDTEIHLTDCYFDNINKYNVEKFHHVPLINEEDEFLHSLDKIVTQEKIQIIFPSTDYELSVLSKNKNRYETLGARVAVSDFHLLNILRNKIKSYEFLKKNGFPVQDIVDINNENIKFPIIGKPAYGFGGKDMIILNNRQEYLSALKSDDLDKYIWQPCIEKFDEFSIDFAIGFDREISPLVIRKRIRTVGGFAVITQSENDERIHSEVSNLAMLLRSNGGCGIFNVQIFRFADNCYCFTDINPRVGTSSVFSLGAGLNLPLFMCSLLDPCLYIFFTPPEIETNIRMIRNLDERWIKLIPENDVEGVVFDLDDTIVNQKKWITDKLQIIYEQYTKFLPDKYLFTLAASRFLEEGKRSALIDEIAELFSLSPGLRDDLINSYRAAKPSSIETYRDTRPTLLMLKQAGFKLAILTDNPVASQKQKLDLIDFTDIFDEIIFSNALGTEKPDRLLFDETASRLDIDNTKLVMVGDNLYRDVYGSLNAKYKLSYFIERKGAFFNFDFDHFVKISGLSAEKFIRIKSLNDVTYSLLQRCS